MQFNTSKKQSVKPCSDRGKVMLYFPFSQPASQAHFVPPSVLTQEKSQATLTAHQKDERAATGANSN
jgi:hypothetical protein